MDLLITKIQDVLNKQANSEKTRSDGTVKAKDSFWCSETETPLFDLYHKWMGTPPTNVPAAANMLIMDAGKMIEVSLVNILNDLGFIVFDKEEPQKRVEMNRMGIKITGYIDAVLSDGSVAEIKSFYGDYQATELREGKPRPSYLKQLACYMDFMDMKIGRLIYVHRGTGELFEFVLERQEGLKFKCLDVEFDLEDTYRRWSQLYYENILPNIEPSSEFRYKIPVGKIDWSKVSKTDIMKARNNQKVIGDGWQVNYSPYKNLIIEREGSCLGYTDLELEIIRRETKGYSKK